MLLLFIAVLNIFPIQNLSYEDIQIQQQRIETTENIKSWLDSKTIKLKWRTYTLKKNDNFFNIMAKTMLNHDTLSSVNRLASLWDTDPNDAWLIPNMRGVAEYGTPEQLSKKYHIDINLISAVPNVKDLWFIPGAKFAENEKEYFNLKAFIRPVSGYISSDYGLRNDPFKQKKKFHKGIDIACPIGSNVKAAATGEVIFTGWIKGYGNAIIIKHQNDYETIYGHLSRITIKNKSNVKQGTTIALSGNTGSSTGPHLHFEVKRKGKPLNPPIS